VEQAELVIFTLAVLLEQLVVEVAQDLLVLVQQALEAMAVMAVQAAAVVVALLTVLLLVQAVTALFIFTTKEF
jgi:hypothetical protein